MIQKNPYDKRSTIICRVTARAGKVTPDDLPEDFDQVMTSVLNEIDRMEVKDVN